jgi:N-methylhydantoinase A/oxoprolinase/acetone carboxylase beta subunit
MLTADVTRDYSASVLTAALDITIRDLKSRIAPLVHRARTELGREGFSAAKIRIAEQIDVRYVGQSYEITLPFTASFGREFHRRHGAQYGYSNPDRPIEVVAVRVQAAGISQKPRLPFSKPKATTARPHAVRSARFDGVQKQTGYFRWPDLSPGATAVGPAVIAGPEATAVVPPGWRFAVDGFGNVICSDASRRRRQ